MRRFRFGRCIAEGEPIVVFGDGSQERDFTYVDDIARGVCAALQLEGHHTINLGSDRPHRLSETEPDLRAPGRPAGPADATPASGTGPPARRSGRR